jgi:anhydro-N-acetylmuramic acid kinase
MGGGSKNNFIIKTLQEKLNYTLYTADQLALPGQYIEAELIAFLASRKVNKLPITFPSTTGVNVPIIGGKIYKFK